MRWKAGSAALFALAAAAGAASGAEKWPTTAFEVHEGPGRGFGGSITLIEAARAFGLEKSDIDQPAATPLSADLKREMEKYLSEVAVEYQRMGFPPPALEPIVTRPDGSRAYRVYFFEFGASGQLKGLEQEVALAAHGCKGEPHLRRLSFNAAIAGPNGPRLRLAESTGKVPGRLDRLTDKGYGDLAHELFHVVQRGTAFFDANCEPPTWLVEGQAEAVGHDMAWKLRGIRSAAAYMQVNRWGMRPYFHPFHPEGSRPEGEVRQEGYGTSSLWRYLAELERDSRSDVSPPPRPDAGPLPGRDAFDYRYLARLLSDSTRLGDGRQTIDWLDRWLKNDPRLRSPLDRVFPDFISVFADYGRHRLLGSRPIDERRDTFQKLVLDGCDPIRLDLFAAAPPPPVGLTLPAIAADCLRVERTDGQPGKLLVDVRTQVPLQAAQSLYLGIAGRPATKADVSTPVQPGSDAIASWTVAMDPGETLDLVFSNIAEQAGRSRAIKAEMAFAISGWTAQGPPFDPSLHPAARRAPRTRAPAGRSASGRSDPVTQGPGAARLERELPEPQPRACRWEYADAKVQCGPTMRVVLRELPRWMAHQDQVIGDIDDAARQGTLDGFVATRSSDALQALEAVEVQLKLPLLDFGFQGTIDNVLVSVSSSTWPTGVSRGPRDADPGRLTYFPASGRVVIEEYGPLVLRGRFEASLVAENQPLASTEPLPSAPVLGEVSGRFTVGQPWRGDERYQAEPPSADQIASSIFDRLPGPLRTDPVFSATGADDAAPAGNAPATTGAQCDCSCAGREALLVELEKLDEQEEGAAIDGGQLANAMCMLSCSAAYSRCP